MEWKTTEGGRRPLPLRTKDALLSLQTLLKTQIEKDKIDLSNLVEQLDKVKFGGS